MEKVSIITPTYNSSKFIVSTIDSIINQTYTNWELLITDDCSSDNTSEIIHEYMKNDKRIKIFQLNENSGAGVARNTSIKNAKGRYIAFCDSDDMWKPDKLQKQVGFMLNYGYALTYTSYDIIDENGAPKGEIKARPYVTYSDMLKSDYIGCLTAMYDVKKLGKMYMSIIRKRQDWALWLSILKKIPKAYSIQEKLSIYRYHSKSISSNKIELLNYNWQVYRQIEGFSSISSLLLMIRFIIYYFFTKYMTKIFNIQ